MFISNPIKCRKRTLLRNRIQFETLQNSPATILTIKHLGSLRIYKTTAKLSRTRTFKAVTTYTHYVRKPSDKNY